MLKVKTLGKFSLSDGTNVLNDDTLRSDMLKKLVIYILMHRNQPVSTQKLLEALWDEDETDKPMGALKNLMYRLRSILKTTFGDSKFIITSPGAYYWNPEIEVTIDIEEFEKYIQLAKFEQDKGTAIENYEKALDFWQGDFMDNVLDEHWAVTIAAYYRSLFLSAAKELANLYMGAERYEDMEYICLDALRFDNVNEQMHCNYIMSLIKQNKLELAAKSYDDAAKILYDAFGIRNSGKLLEVQKELLKMNTGDAEETMENIYEDMTEDGKKVGVFICGYPVFREIYRLEARKISRLGESEFVVLITVGLSDKAKTENAKMEQFLLKQAMKQLKESLKETLRIGDVATRYSNRQFMILLHACTYENSVAVSKRIISKFYEKNKGKKVTIKFEFEQVMAVKSDLVR